MDSKDPQNDPDAITGPHELILSTYKAIIGDGPLVTSPKILGELPANPRGHRRTSVEEEVNIEIKAIILAVVLAGSQTKHVDVILTVGHTSTEPSSSPSSTMPSSKQYLLEDINVVVVNGEMFDFR